MATFLKNVDGVIEVQAAGLGRGSRDILDITQDVKSALGGFDKSLGSLTRGTRISPRTNRPVPRPARRGEPDPITPELTCPMVAANYIERFGAEDRFGLYVRHTSGATQAQNRLGYLRVDILTDVAVESFNYGDFVSNEQSDETDIVLTVPLNAASHVRVLPVQGKKIVTGWATANDCDVVAAAVDADGVIFAVTEADGTGTHPYLLKSADDGATWEEIELADLTTNCTALAVAGDFLVIAAGTALNVYDREGVLQNGTTAAGALAAVAAIDAANLVAVGAAGLVMVSDDGGLTWDSVTTGVSVALSSIAARSINQWYVGGATGTLLAYTDGTVSALTLPAGLAAATITAIALPDAPAGFTREEDLYIGASSGTVWKSLDGGARWSQVRFSGDGAGSVTALAFCEFLGQVLYVLHTPAGGSSVLFRDWSGGTGGNTNMEAVDVPTNSGINALLALNANNAWLLGNVHSTADMVIKVED